MVLLKAIEGQCFDMSLLGCYDVLVALGLMRYHIFSNTYLATYLASVQRAFYEL